MRLIENNRLTNVNLALYNRNEKPFTKLTKMSHYPLKLVKSLAASGSVAIRSKALKTAEADFGWKRDDIIRAFKRLSARDFYKTAPKYDSSPAVMVDYYKAWNMMGEQVYIHFRIDDKEDGQFLVICSFKRI